MATADLNNKKDEAVLHHFQRSFISGCHILHYHNVLDAYGHLSFRHPFKHDVFVMSRYIAPGTISSPNDLIEYHVKDAEPLDPTSSKGYSERCIHSECYKRFPNINSVIHSHSEAVVPYSISGVKLQACYHMAGFLGTGVPVWDIGDAYRTEDTKDMLVRNIHLGADLAKSFSGSEEEGGPPSHVVALMRGHGFTVIAESIEDCVLRAVFTQKNATIQTTALITRGSISGQDVPPVKYLSEEEAKAATDMTRWSAQRPWKLWLREVEASSLYVNSA